ncbi:hypothetical protein [Adhaeribacter pallidiroseus]|uniref:Uncharacterized protein n=1 Tax=Adhaeribacter pallidiroseus TaxID=2072847 RepID=A0A369QJV2_9BACT|nr:hypothetical protein [Adhaeribacter pallidiroseus]RDC64590.1 hypothetical protein AHMF7616_03206 [Adhaeribacter pallidiroseus]
MKINPGNFRKLFLLKSGIYFVIIGLYSCAGTTNTVIKTTPNTSNYTKAYIISAVNSQYIKFKFGAITPFGYIVLPDDSAQKHEVIGNTDFVIKKELEKIGISAEIGNKEIIPEGFDLIVMYNDTWRWDFKKVLDKLEIVFISPDGREELARSTFNIYPNKELHNFPTPEKEVPKMLNQLLKK